MKGYIYISGAMKDFRTRGCGNRVGRVGCGVKNNQDSDPHCSTKPYTCEEEIYKGIEKNIGNPDNTDRREVILGMSVADALHIWHSEGAPLIHLGPGENCEDLEKLLNNRDVKPEHLEAVRRRLEKSGG